MGIWRKSGDRSGTGRSRYGRGVIRDVDQASNRTPSASIDGAIWGILRESAGLGACARPGEVRMERLPRCPRPELACAIAVALVGTGLTLPATLARWWLTQDAVEHLAIAHAWVEGAGFVDPIQWAYAIDSKVPYPAIALRAPAISWIAAIPFALGATLSTVGVLHGLWASAIAAALVPAARRCGLRWPAGLAAALLLATSPAWLAIARHAWTEATALLAFLAVLMTARGAIRSVPGALVCAAATFAAYLCRPNLIALGAAVVVAGAWEFGGRRLRPNRAIVAYGAALALAWLAYRGIVLHATGEAPSSRYAVLFQIRTSADAWEYGRVWPGTAAFVSTHASAFLDRATAALADLARAFCLETTWNGLGLLALPGFAWSLARGGAHAFERRVAALSGLGLAIVALPLPDFDRIRYPLFTAAAGALCGFAALDDLARRAAATAWIDASGRRVAARRALALAPLALAALPLLASLPESIHRSAGWWRDARAHGTVERLWPRMDALIRPLCGALETDAIVASIDPWTTHLWCGQAALMLPSDIDRPGLLERFLERAHPGQLVAPGEDPVLRRSPRLEHVAEIAGLAVWRVRDAPAASRSWRAPLPLACAGRIEDCPVRKHE